MKNIQLIIACHKECEVPSDEVYLPLHVGAEGKETFGFVTDNTGENISSKNNLYCELTGLYWAGRIWIMIISDWYITADISH